MYNLVNLLCNNATIDALLEQRLLKSFLPAQIHERLVRMVLLHVCYVHIPVDEGRIANAAPIGRLAAVRSHVNVPHRLAVETLAAQSTLEVARLVVYL